MRRFDYRFEILEQLAKWGIRPLPTTDPERVRDLVNDLYRLEIRRLRSEIRRRERDEDRKLRGEYSRRVTDLRLSYPVLSLPASAWVENPAGRTPEVTRS